MLWIALALPRLPSASSPSPEPVDWPALACWAGRYTPRVTLATDAAGIVLLRFEVAASLRLFGGLPCLRDAMVTDLAHLHCPLVPAIAHTPRAAAWLAYGGVATPCLDAVATRAALAALPLAALPLAPDIAQRLAGFGLRRLADVMALPCAAVAARLGRAFADDLARALGDIHEPLPWFVFPDTFALALELPAPVEAAPVLLFAARRLVASLAGWLAARQAALRELHWHIDHGQGRITPLVLRFAMPVHEPARIERVLKEALDALRLPAPALALRVSAPQSEPHDAASRPLFADALRDADATDALSELLDRLTARLGADAVAMPSALADYRPERASGFGTPCAAPANGAQARGKRPRSASHVKPAAKHSRGDTAQRTPHPPTPVPGAGVTVAPRDGHALHPPPVSKHSRGDTAPDMLLLTRQPLWRYAAPQPLHERGGRPWRNGPLTLLAGPERIESGWWDDGDIRRDYFIALDIRQRWLWIYRTCDAPVGWYLHGEFA